MGTPEMRKATDSHFSFAVIEQSSRDHYPGAHPIYSWSIYFASTIKLWSSAQGISIPGDTRTKTQLYGSTLYRYVSLFGTSNYLEYIFPHGVTQVSEYLYQKAHAKMLCHYIVNI